MALAAAHLAAARLAQRRLQSHLVLLPMLQRGMLPLLRQMLLLAPPLLGQLLAGAPKGQLAAPIPGRLRCRSGPGSQQAVRAEAVAQLEAAVPPGADWVAVPCAASQRAAAGPLTAAASAGQSRSARSRRGAAEGHANAVRLQRQGRQGLLQCLQLAARW